MRLSELARTIDAKVLTHEEKAGRIEIQRVYAGDRMSNLLSEGSETTLLVTNLSNTLLPRVAELVDAAGICMLNGVSPDADVVRAAEERGIVIMVSPAGMFETCGRFYECLDGMGSGVR